MYFFTFETSLLTLNLIPWGEKGCFSFLGAAIALKHLSMILSNIEQELSHPVETFRAKGDPGSVQSPRHLLATPIALQHDWTSNIIVISFTAGWSFPVSSGSAGS